MANDLTLYNVYVRDSDHYFERNILGLTEELVKAFLQAYGEGREEVIIYGDTIKIRSFSVIKVYDLSLLGSYSSRGDAIKQIEKGNLLTKAKYLNLIKRYGVDVTDQFNIPKYKTFPTDARANLKVTRFWWVSKPNFVKNFLEVGVGYSGQTIFPRDDEQSEYEKIQVGDKLVCVDLKQTEKRAVQLKIGKKLTNSEEAIMFLYSVENVFPLTSSVERIIESTLGLLAIKGALLSKLVYRLTPESYDLITENFARYKEESNTDKKEPQIKRGFDREGFRKVAKDRLPQSLEEVKQNYPKVFQDRINKDAKWFVDPLLKLERINNSIEREAVEEVITKLRKDNYQFTEQDEGILDSFRSNINAVVKVNNFINNYGSDKLDIVRLFNEAKELESYPKFKNSFELSTPHYIRHLPSLYSVIKHCQFPQVFPLYYKYWKKLANFLFEIKEGDYNQFYTFYSGLTKGFSDSFIDFGAYMGVCGVIITELLGEYELTDNDIKYIRKTVLTLEEFEAILESSENGPDDGDDVTEEGGEDTDGGENDNASPEKDRIPFHLDQVTDTDQLGREPVAKAFVNLLLKDIFTEKLDHSFMVHLQGEWGAGKSSFLKLITKNLNVSEKKKKWIVVEYNAWQHQHIQPPWWTFINQIYQQSRKQLKCCSKFNLLVKEWFRRVIWYSSWKKILALFATVIFIWILCSNWETLYNFTTSVYNPEEVNNQQKGLAIEVMAKILLSISSIVGVLYSLGRLFSGSLLLNSSDDAISFQKRSRDPMKKIKRHFNELIGDVSSEDREIAIYIDDIDRCNKEFVVELMEGIQTLFKEKRCLYIIAGDKRWITKSFGNTYKEFKNEGETTEELGDLFLEKAFQLSLRLPEVTDESKQKYWMHILGEEGTREGQENPRKDVNDLSSEEKAQLDSSLQENREKWVDPAYLNELQENFNLTGDTVSNIVIEKSNEDTEELRHLLLNFHNVIDPNPRKIKRLANNYTMTRSTLQVERRSFSPEKLFRWLAIANQFPKFEQRVMVELSWKEIEGESLNKLIPVDMKASFEVLLNDPKGKYGGPLTENEVLSILGKN